MFYGYCFNEDGTHTPSTKLDSTTAAIIYCTHQMYGVHEVRITDDDDVIVLQAINGEVVFPIIHQYEVNCNNCGHTFIVEHTCELTYEDITCPNCGTYEDLFLNEID